MLDAGSHVIATDDLYGGTYRLFERVKKRNDQKQANAVRFTESRLRAYVDGFDWPTDDEHPTVVTTG